MYEAGDSVTERGAHGSAGRYTNTATHGSCGTSQHSGTSE
jgi:hypothetical protein